MFKTYETQAARKSALEDARGYGRETVMSTIVRKVIDGHVAYVREPAGTLGEIWDKANANGVAGVHLGHTDHKETGLVTDPYYALGTAAVAADVVSEELALSQRDAVLDQEKLSHAA